MTETNTNEKWKVNDKYLFKFKWIIMKKKEIARETAKHIRFVNINKTDLNGVDFSWDHKPFYDF